MKNSILNIRILSRQHIAYPITIGTHTSRFLAPIIRKKFRGYALMLITDSTVKKLYGNELEKKLKKTFPRVHLFSFPAGEQYKTQTTKTNLDCALLKKQCARNTLIIALGGGVVGDIAGFVASTYLRGVPYIQVPTTLLAMVDSSVGGKTGIDTLCGKNTIGAFWQPSAVIINTSYLKTLSDVHWRSGIMESAKICLTMRPDMKYPLLEAMEKKSETAVRKIILLSLKEKAKVVERDEKEKGERMVLNFGHTIGHAIEKLSEYSMLHGTAVGIGMLVEARISHELGILPCSSLARIEALLYALGVEPTLLQKWKSRDIIAATMYDKKKRGEKPLYVLLKDIGSVYRKGNQWAHVVDDKVMLKVCNSFF